MQRNISGTPIVLKLIAITVVVYIIQQIIGGMFTGIFGLTPALVVKEKMFWQVFTYMFLHSPQSFLHIFFNMYALYLFGLSIEQVWGSRMFLKYYLFCGVGAGLCVLIAGLTSGNAGATTIGASGATFGVLVAFGLMFPDVKIYLLFFPFGIKAKFLVFIYAIIEIYAEVGGFQPGISHVAHLGGLVSGLIFFALFVRRRKPVVNKYTAQINKARAKHAEANKREINADRKKHIIEKLQKDPDIHHLSDDEYQYIKYLDIMYEETHNKKKHENYDLNNLSDEEFIRQVRKHIEVE